MTEKNVASAATIAVQPSHIDNPAANPRAGSTKRSAYSMKLPETGNAIVISDILCSMPHTHVQTTTKPSTRDPGPPRSRFVPVEMKRPAPICPPRERTWIWRGVNERRNSPWSGTSWTVVLAGSSIDSEVVSNSEVFSDDFIFVDRARWTEKNVTVTTPNIYTRRYRLSSDT